VNRALYLRAGALYLPMLLALAAGRLRRQPPRQFAACLLSLLWTLPALLVLQRLNQLAHWWTYPSDGPQLREMPVELYLGWAILWGVLPQLALPRTRLWVCALVLIGFDLIAMRLCAPVVVLGPQWLLGEAVAMLLVLAPALSIARWTLNNTHLPLRALAQAATSAAIFLYFVPELVFALRPGAGWQPLLQLPSWERQIWLQMVGILAIPGVSAVMEFAQRGRGTPIPYDPPRRLVTSGIYRYCANPMQLSCAAVMLVWAAMLRNPWLLLPAGFAIAYSAGIAEWDESEDLARRFGQEWLFYRMWVRNWRLRWRPHHVGPRATLYIASTCGPCSEVRGWFEARKLVGLVLVDAETLDEGSIQRVRYDPGDGTGAVEGVGGVARGLEHLNLGWALVGAAMRLPVVWQFIQLTMDAAGFGPRSVPSFSHSSEM
jgi:protein-S-isoprenylcysteine O-methyltransferase Ste14